MSKKKEEGAQTTISTSFKFSSALEQKVNEQIIADGYGMRGKSQWVKEALESFLRLPDYSELTYLSDSAEASRLMSIRIPRELVLKIESAMVEIRKDYPDLEGLKSKIIRSSIYQRLIRGV